MDRSFFRFELVWIGAGSASHMAAIGPPELQRLSGASTFDLTSRG
jgi:prolyl-tRNA editing enzyme YbaK/EbsC (Cys-tRNA(Pro) deacylase)